MLPFKHTTIIAIDTLESRVSFFSLWSLAGSEKLSFISTWVSSAASQAFFPTCQPTISGVLEQLKSRKSSRGCMRPTIFLDATQGWPWMTLGNKSRSWKRIDFSLLPPDPNNAFFMNVCCEWPWKLSEIVLWVYKYFYRRLRDCKGQEDSSVIRQNVQGICGQQEVLFA